MLNVVFVQLLSIVSKDKVVWPAIDIYLIASNAKKVNFSRYVFFNLKFSSCMLLISDRAHGWNGFV